VDYADDGTILKSPRQVDAATLFLNHSWTVDPGLDGPLSYRLSHTEVVTLEALPNAAKAWMGSTGLFSSFWGQT
jgi:hypothetical protein